MVTAVSAIVQRDHGRAPGAAGFVALTVGFYERRALKDGVRRGAEGAGAFAVDDADFEYPASAAGFEIGGDQLFQIARVKGMQVEFAGDGDLDWIIAGIGWRLLGGHGSSGARLIVGRFGGGLI